MQTLKFGSPKKVPTPQVDCSKLTLHNINSTEYSHVKLLIGWPIYFLLFFLTENLIPYRKCHIVHSVIDDIVPFNEYFVIFYCSWFALVFFSLLYFFIYDCKSFKRLQTFIIITQIFAMAAYIFYPTIQLSRPEILGDNICCKIVAFIYAFDTPTGVCPSLHIAYSLGILSAWYKTKISTLKKIGLFVWIVLIAMSVLYIKQHSFLDIIAALPICLIAELTIRHLFRNTTKKKKGN